MTSPLRELYYRLPQGLQHAILVRRRTPVWLRAGILFIHVPKAAGTSINQSLYDRFMGHVRARDVERWGSKELRALPSFAVTRNPWDRLVSAYRFVKRGSGVGRGLQAGVWRPQLYQVPEFQTFERFVIEWLAHHEIGPLEYQFQPQSDYVCDESGKVLVDHVGHVEDLGPTLDFLRDHLDRMPDVPTSNRSGEKVDYRTFYTPELVEIVGRVYAQDVRNFGYSFD